MFNLQLNYFGNNHLWVCIIEGNIINEYEKDLNVWQLLYSIHLSLHLLKIHHSTKK